MQPEFSLLEYSNRLQDNAQRHSVDDLVQDCFYTPIGEMNNEALHLNRVVSGYNLFSDLRIEEASNTIACCLTAYNEPLSAYRTTLTALCRCADYFLAKGEHRIARELIICIIVDGLDSLDAEFVQYAEHIGLMRTADLRSDVSYHMFEARVPRSVLLGEEKLSADGKSQRAFYSQWDPHQRVVVFVKQKNAGKLDSHRCFFDVICSMYRYTYFLQVDVGTAPDDAALYNMWRLMNSDAHIAAAAARSHLPVAHHAADMLSLWQFFDICLERIVNWPTELMVGNLSVLPGQLSLTRIDAVTGRQSNDEKDQGVLPVYYRGLKALKPFESNMYLAEDRILGLEMVFKEKGRWELAYAVDAEATVDACEDWNELARQRRRWICSSTACRLALLKKLPNVYGNPDRTAVDKAHKTLASVYFLFYSLLEWLVPAAHFALQAALFSSVQQLTVPGLVGVALTVLWSLSMLAYLPQLVVCLQPRLRPWSNKMMSVSLTLQTLSIAASALSILVFSSANIEYMAVFLSLAFMLLGYCVLARLYSKTLLLPTAKSVLQYLVMRLPVKAFLMTYALFNCHDTSWGTKGLQSSVDTQKNQRFRLVAIGIFLFSNALVAFGLINTALSPLALITVLVSVINVQVLLAFVAYFVKAHSIKRALPV